MFSPDIVTFRLVATMNLFSASFNVLNRDSLRIPVLKV